MFQKSISLFVVSVFFITTLTPLPQAHAQSFLGLPEPGSMVTLSAAYKPAILKGITVHQDNPFMFDFLVDIGQDKIQGEQLKSEGDKLIKYFMATLAIPEQDLWVNLSPYEKDRTVPEALAQTDMGRDLLAQDYMLKQLTASLIYPEKELGKKFWDKVYQKTQAKYGNINIPVNTFNKVWIMADKAEVFERNQTMFVTGSHLKVMLEDDYLASQTNSNVETRFIASQTTNRTTQNIIRDIILPEVENEINTGKNFANLRQIFNSIILASWYKNNLKQSLLNEAYANKGTVKGIDIDDKTITSQIYERYLQAYKKGVFNFVKENEKQRTPRKYFSGGVNTHISVVKISESQAMMALKKADQTSMARLNVVLDYEHAKVAVMKQLIDSTINAPLVYKGVTLNKNGLSAYGTSNVKVDQDQIIVTLTVDKSYELTPEKKLQDNVQWGFDQTVAKIMRIHSSAYQWNVKEPIKNSDGKTVYSFVMTPRKAIKKDAAMTIQDIIKTLGSPFNVRVDKEIISLPKGLNTLGVIVVEMREGGEGALVSWTVEENNVFNHLGKNQAVEAIAAFIAHFTVDYGEDYQATALTNEQSVTNHEGKKVIIYQIMIERLINERLDAAMRIDELKRLKEYLERVPGNYDSENMKYTYHLNDGYDLNFRDLIDRINKKVAPTKTILFEFDRRDVNTFPDPIIKFSYPLSPSLLLDAINQIIAEEIFDHAMMSESLSANLAGLKAGDRVTVRYSYVIDVFDDNPKRGKATETGTVVSVILSDGSKAGELVVDIKGDRRNFHYGNDANLKDKLENVVKSSTHMPMKADNAMNGGINLKDVASKTNVNKEGFGVKFVVDAATIERVRREGIQSLTPVILRIDPLVNIWPLLGLTH